MNAPANCMNYLGTCWSWGEPGGQNLGGHERERYERWAVHLVHVLYVGRESSFWGRWACGLETNGMLWYTTCCRAPGGSFFLRRTTAAAVFL